jgi:hypothetical protein
MWAGKRVRKVGKMQGKGSRASRDAEIRSKDLKQAIVLSPSLSFSLHALSIAYRIELTIREASC